MSIRKTSLSTGLCVIAYLFGYISLQIGHCNCVHACGELLVSMTLGCGSLRLTRFVERIL